MSKKKKQKNQYYQDIDRADAIDGNIKDLYKYKNHSHDTGIETDTKTVYKKDINSKYGSDDILSESITQNGNLMDSIDRVLLKYSSELSSQGSAQTKVGERIEDYIDTLTERYDGLFDKLSNENYRDYELYDSIVSDYASLGQKMAKGELADSAAGNGGNADSFGAANAHRQMLAYKNAGEKAAMTAYDNSIKKIIDGIGSYASDSHDGLSLLSQSAEREDDFNLSKLGQYSKYISAVAEGTNTKNGGVYDRSSELDPTDKVDRYESYYKMLLKIYPSFASEITDMFYHT